MSSTTGQMSSTGLAYPCNQLRCDHNQKIWYELLHAGVDDQVPSWLHELAVEHIDFGGGDGHTSRMLSGGGASFAGVAQHS